MHGTIERMIGVLDAQGTVIACSDLTRIGEDDSVNMPAVGGYTYSTAISAGRTYRAIGNDIRPEYVIFVEGGDSLPIKWQACCRLRWAVCGSIITSTTAVPIS